MKYLTQCRYALKVTLTGTNSPHILNNIIRKYKNAISNINIHENRKPHKVH